MDGWTALVLLAAQAAAPPPDPSDLLRRTGETYFGLTAYSAALRVAGGQFGRTAAETRVRIDAGEDREVRLELSTGRAWISDGETLWIWNAGEKEYRELPAAGPDMRWVRGELDKYVGRFAKLVTPPLLVEFVKWEEVKSGGARVRCAVIRLDSDPGQPVWRETLHIDPATGLVLRSLFSQQRWDRETYREINYEWLSTTGPASGVEFRFTPPKGARRRR